MIASLVIYSLAIPVGMVSLLALGSYWYKTEPKSFLAKMFVLFKTIVWGLSFLIGFAGGLTSISILIHEGAVPSVVWAPTVVSAVLFTIIQAIWPVFPNR